MTIKSLLIKQNTGSYKADNGTVSLTDSERFSFIIVTNENKNAALLAERLLKRGFGIVIVAESLEGFNDLSSKDTNERVRIVISASKNIAYKRNLGVYFSRGNWVIHIDSDEIFDDSFINSIHDIDDNYDTYRVLTLGIFSDFILHQWLFYNFRIFKREICHYIGSAHERVPLSSTKIGTINGIIANKSYENWKHYWQKFSVKTSKEPKSIKNFFMKLLAPFFLYLFNDGAKDGKLGIKILITSILYPFVFIINGRTSYKTLPIKHLTNKLKSCRELHPSERDYITKKINELENGKIPNGSSYLEELEQISSPFL